MHGWLVVFTCPPFFFLTDKPELLLLVGWFLLVGLFVVVLFCFVWGVVVVCVFVLLFFNRTSQQTFCGCPLCWAEFCLLRSQSTFLWLPLYGPYGWHQVDSIKHYPTKTLLCCCCLFAAGLQVTHGRLYRNTLCSWCITIATGSWSHSQSANLHTTGNSLIKKCL